MQEVFDVVVYCPLESEFTEVCDIFDYKDDLTTEFKILSLKATVGELSILLVAGDEMGVAAAQSAAAQIKSKCTFKLFVCLGIAGSISDDVNLGDVCYSGKIFDITQNQKITDTGTEFSTTPFRTTAEVTHAFNYFRKHPKLAASKQTWLKKCTGEYEKLCESSEALKELIETFESHSGTIVTGPVTAGKDLKKKIQNIDRKTLAVETEVGGICSFFDRDNQVSVITIRGISDAADEKKSVLEAVTKGAVRKLAVRNAAHFLLQNLTDNEFLLKFLQPNGQISLEFKSCEPSVLDDPLEIALMKSSLRFEQRLREVSPEFHNQDNHFWVPAPRLIGSYTVSRDATPKNIEEILDIDPHVFVNIPATYPDRGAPSLFAIDLMSSELNGRMVVPVYVDCQKMAPPRDIATFTPDFTRAELDTLLKRSDCVLVFIFEDSPLLSLTRFNHIVSELGKQEGCLSISFNSPQNASALSTDIIPVFFSRYEIEAISFSNIARFVGRHFRMEHTQAESVAFRLSQTFDAFDLPAHPSYFAGVPKEFLTKLIDANRRSELIELAVAGFLTFAVADDIGDVRLSRTTRKRFLVDLLDRMEIQGQSLTLEDVNGFAEQMLEEYDFDVNASDFVQKFFDFGLLQLCDNRVEFPIPFIKSFLLAELLASDETKAKRYFSTNADVFDFTTFSLFCEICGGSALFDKILKEVTYDVDNFDKIIGTDGKKANLHALMDASMGPKLLKTKRAIGGLQQQLLQKAEKMLEGDSEAERKQELLDLQSTTRSATHERQLKFKEKMSYEGKWKIVRDLSLARTLVGSGAEHLSAEKKRALALNIIKLLSLIVDDWYRELESIDFDEMKEDVYSDISLKLKEKNNDVSEDEIREFVEFSIDILELELFMGVIPSLLIPLDDYASQPVLLKTIGSLDLNDSTDELFRQIWSVSIDEVKSEKGFKHIIRKLPQRTFTRFSIAMHIVSKAYWLARDDEQKLNLLALAEDVMKPIGWSINREK